MASRPIVAWILPLKGHEFDLEELPIFLDGSVFTVVKRDDIYYLQIPAVAQNPPTNAVVQQADEIVTILNGLAGVLLSGRRPIALAQGGYYGLDEHGVIANTVLAVQSSEIRCKAGHVTLTVNGVPPRDERRGSMVPLLEQAMAHSSKADALAIVGRPMPSWSELYLVHEIVQANVGGRIYDEGWISRSDERLFKHTANSYTALGRRGRHGRDNGSPPTKPMTQQTALSLMRKLVERWLRQEPGVGA